MEGFIAEALSYSALPEIVSRFAEQDRRDGINLQNKRIFEIRTKLFSNRCGKTCVLQAGSSLKMLVHQFYCFKYLSSDDSGFSVALWA